MPLLNANVARFFFEASELSPEVFEVARFTGVERISQLYRYEIDLFSQDAYVDFNKIVGKPATFIMMRGDTPVRVHGEVSDFQQLGRVKDHIAYRVVLVPRLWRLTTNFQSYIYQRLTVEEIITQVLNSNGVYDFRFQLADPSVYEAREYCVQFRETDFNFISRLMEHEGMYYFFEQDEQKATIVITDDHTALGPIEGERTLEYHPGEGMTPEDVEAIQDFLCREQAYWPSQVTLKDYNDETPSEYLVGWSQASDSNKPGFGFHYDYGEAFKTTGEGERIATMRREEFESRRRIFHGGSNCVGLRSGYTISMENHYRSDFDEDYLIVEVRHQGSQRHAMGFDVTGEEQSDSGVVYHNTFQCRVASVPYRTPCLTPVPKVPGVMVAVVDHPDRGRDDRGHVDDYAHIDDQGRYRAYMDFDEHRENTPADNTLPIRMVQPYAGPNYGMHFPNHGGTEMIFACLNGDIDRPIALGTIPNPNHVSPSLNANRWQSVIRTWGQNELTFDDKQGEENIYMHATKDHTVDVTNNESITVGNDQSISVGHDRTKSVGNDEKNTIKMNRWTAIDEGEEWLGVMKGNRTILVDTGSNSLVVEGNCFRTVRTGNDVVVVSTGEQHVYVKKDARLLVDGKRQETAKSDYTIESENSKIHLTAKTEIKLTVGNSSITITPNKISVSSQEIELVASPTSNIKIKPDGIDVSSPKIGSKAIGVHEITGAMVKIN